MEKVKLPQIKYKYLYNYYEYPFYIRQNITSVSILVFTIIFIVIQFAEPNFYIIKEN